jgi:putative ABC transport system permease protein
MRALDRKLLRDLTSMKGQMTAVGMVLVCGLTVMVMERSLVISLESSKTAYYQTHRLADVFCDLKRAPNMLASRLARIPHVATVETRVRGTALLDIPGMKQMAQAVIISLPDAHPQHLNLLFLTAGRFPLPGHRREVVISQPFAEAHGFLPGDAIDATIHGGRERLEIVGIALSPEYVYELPPGGITPDNRRYGVFWMGETDLAIALGLEGGFNNVIVDVAPNGDIQAVKADLDRILVPYGGLTAYDRTEQLSVKMVDDEIRGLRAVALIFPLVFLGIAAFMTSATLTRLVRLQREQIAQLKAFGYTSVSVGLHYLCFALVVVALATIAGALAGLWMGSELIYLYHPFFRFPSLTFHPDWQSLAIAVPLGAAVSILGVFGAVRQAMGLPPAEAMRPEPPTEFRPSILEHLGLHTWVSPSLRMALRNLKRKPWQALFTISGLTLATAIPIVSVSMDEGMDYVMDFQWRLAQRQDVTLSLIEPAGSGGLNSINALPGVLRAEPYRSVPALLVRGHRSRRIGVMGLPRNAHLNRLLDIHERPVHLPISGLLLSAQLADILDVRPGESIQVEVQEGRRPVLEMIVAGTITDFAGIGAYMDIDRLRSLLQEGKTISGAHVRLDHARKDLFFAAVKKTPRIASFTVTNDVRAAYDRIMGKMMAISQGIFFFFAIVVAFGVVYNGTRIVLSERTRDLATLRVLGFTQKEVVFVLVGELTLLTLLALLPGLYLGSELTRIILESVNTETLRIPVILTGRAYAIAVLIVLVSSCLSFIVAGRRIARLDLVGVMKAGE